MSILAIEDVFAAGVGCDVIGAVLLARGLVSSPAELRKRSGVAYSTVPKPVLDGMLEDRIDAVWGLRALLSGFALQAIGYIALMAFGASHDHGLATAFVALVCGVAPALLFYLGWRRARSRWKGPVSSDRIPLWPR